MESAADQANPHRVAGNKSYCKTYCRQYCGLNAGNIPKAYVSTKEGYQEGKKQVEASGYDKGVEEGKQTSQKKVASSLARAERLQLEFAYESMASQNFKLRLDNLAAENRRLRHQLSLESPREDDGAGSG